MQQKRNGFLPMFVTLGRFRRNYFRFLYTNYINIFFYHLSSSASLQYPSVTEIFFSLAFWMLKIEYYGLKQPQPSSPTPPKKKKNPPPLPSLLFSIILFICVGRSISPQNLFPQSCLGSTPYCTSFDYVHFCRKSWWIFLDQFMQHHA